MNPTRWRFTTLWRFVTLMLAALSMGTAFCHLMEMPAKLDIDGDLWLTLLQTLYPPTFGSVGAFFEVGAMVAALVLAFLVRHRQPALRWTIVALLCMMVAHAVFWVAISPVNAALGPLTPETLPADWSALRDRWEYSHGVRAVLQVIALGVLLVSILVEIPRAASGVRHRAARLRLDPLM
jgi:hypothetical protein